MTAAARARAAAPRPSSPLALALALAAAAALAPAAAAHPLDSFSFGARAAAMGGAVTATAQGMAAGYHNPAGLARDDALRVEIGYVFVEPRLRMNGGDLDVDPTQGVQAGLSLGGPVGPGRLAFSLALHLPDGLISRTRSLRQQQPRFVLYDNRPQRPVVSASLAYEVVRDLVYLGAGVTFLSDTRGRLDVQGDVDFFDADKTLLITAVREDLKSIRYPSAGLLVTPGPWRFGFAWRQEFSLSLDLDVDIRGDVVVDGEPLVEGASFLLVSRNTNHFTPLQLAWGVAYDGGGWLVEADLTWARWSRFPAPTSRVTVELDLVALEADIPPPDLPLAPGFHDIVIPRLAAEGTVLETEDVTLVVRGGWFWEPTPAPGQPGLTNYVDADKHGLSLGLTVGVDALRSHLPRPFELDVAGLLVLMPERTFRKDDPADPVGDYVAGGLFFGVNTTLRFLF